MILNNGGPAGQLQDFIIRQAETLTVFLGNGNGLGGILSTCLRVDHFNLFGAQLFLNDRPVSGLQSGFENEKLIRIDGTLYHRLTKPVGPCDQNGILESRFRINGKDNSR